jgi:hypothetical protein
VFVIKPGERFEQLLSRMAAEGKRGRHTQAAANADTERRQCPHKEKKLKDARFDRHVRVKGERTWVQALHELRAQMMEDMMDSAMDTEEMEDETDAEVDKVLTEIAGDTLASLAGSAAPARKAQPARVAQEPSVEEEEDDGLQARLDAVRS